MLHGMRQVYMLETSSDASIKTAVLSTEVSRCKMYEVALFKGDIK